MCRIYGLGQDKNQNYYIVGEYIEAGTGIHSSIAYQQPKTTNVNSTVALSGLFAASSPNALPWPGLWTAFWAEVPKTTPEGA